MSAATNKSKHEKVGRKAGRAEFTRRSLHKELLDVLYITPSQAQDIVNIILKTMTDALWRGEEVSIPGFGIFRTRLRPAKRCNSLIVDGKTGARAVYKDSYHPKADRVVKFYPAKSLEAMLNLENPTYKHRRVIARWKRK